MEQRVVLSGKQVTTGYGKGTRATVVHERLDFRLLSGELTCLLGCNGAGKSTLLRTLAAVQPALSGQLELMGRPLSDYSAQERSRTVGLVLTDRTQTGGLSVFELVALGRQPHTGFFGRLTTRDKDIVYRAMESVGIADKARSYAAELSDGERQKAMIAKALVQECPLIILDEPTAFLDVVSRIEVMALLHRLAVEEDKAVLLSTHDIDQALVLADKLWLMPPGRGLVCGVTEDVILSGGMDALFSHPSIHFDSMHGVYSPTVGGERKIVLETDDEVLRHWTQNALNRHGYLCLPEASSSGIPLLNVLSAQELRLQHKGHELCFGAIGELLSYLVKVE